MEKMLRKITGIIFGIIIGITVIGIIEMIGFSVITPPDRTDPASISEHLENISTLAIVFVLIAWASGSFVGGSISAFLSKSHSLFPPIIIGSVLMTTGIYTMMEIPNPLWFRTISVFMFIPFSIIGTKVIKI